MGRRGPPPTPTETLKLRGSTLVTKRRMRDEVKGLAGAPHCPDWLDSDAKAVWRQVAPQLQAMNVLTRIDVNLLARYCRLWTRWRKVEAFIDERGVMYPIKDESGNVRCLQQFPQVGIANNLAQHLTRLEGELGMSPSSRSRIQLQQHGSQTPNAKSRFFDTA